jgi:hypothetical protein
MARNGICSPLILVLCASIIIHVSIASDVFFLSGSCALLIKLRRAGLTY